MQRQTSSLAPLVIVCFAVLVPAAYPLSYLALADHDYLRVGSCVVDMSRRGAYYRVGGDTAATFYQPLERLDRWVRPDYWRPQHTWPGTWDDIEIVNIQLESVPATDDNKNIATPPASPTDSSPNENTP